MGTQPASFSYSSIASTILVVMFAKHCGKNNTHLNRSTNDFQHSGKLRLTPSSVKSKLGLSFEYNRCKTLEIFVINEDNF